MTVCEGEGPAFSARGRFASADTGAGASSKLWAERGRMVMEADACPFEKRRPRAGVGVGAGLYWAGVIVTGDLRRMVSHEKHSREVEVLPVVAYLAECPRRKKRADIEWEFKGRKKEGKRQKQRKEESQKNGKLDRKEGVLVIFIT